ncbi:MAG: DUF3106 domain-containing protein [Hyphomicrobiales bacterium]|nr:MAG: DUF3106 domain-containing protein [Hyphomicrobiales bacterium]
MHTLPPDAPRFLPAAVLAFVLLGALAVGGWRVMTQVRTAPSTPLPAQALSDTHTAVSPRSSRRPALVRPAQDEAGPGWSTLTTAQKEVLYPLAERWALLSEVQKRHWLNLSGTFKTLSPDEQQKMVARITDWASLSTQQRSQARLNYAAASSRLTSDSKKAQWEAYQALAPEEKKRLAAKAAPKPAGAATALRPVSPRKLAKVPAAAVAVNASPANLPKIPPVADFHVTQALPVSVPLAPIVVETAPVSVPVAVPASLPPLDATPTSEPSSLSSDEPIHQPQ